jgi:hypothetical protein
MNFRSQDLELRLRFAFAATRALQKRQRHLKTAFDAISPPKPIN